MNYKFKMRYILILIGLVSSQSSIFGQNVTLNVYNNQTEIHASGSITLLPGFTIPVGSTVRIWISPVDFLKVDQFRGVPSSEQNYIANKVFKRGGISTDTDVASSLTTSEVMQTISYFDGLGRPSQNVITQGSPNFRDIVMPMAYDAFGRENVKYQAFAAPTGTYGAYRSSAISSQSSYYANPDAGVKATPNPYSVSVFESSPLNRILEQGAPGASWQPANGHTLKTDYLTNTNNDAVKMWTPSGNGATTVFNYPVGKLYKTIVKDENWIPSQDKIGTTEEYKDFQGHVVLKRIWESNSKSLSTYYIYDDYGNLRYVLPPALSVSNTSSFTESDVVFRDYIYGYHYDPRNRIVEKKIPGKGWEHLVYNILDQLVFSQDSIQRINHQQKFVKYDGLGRVIMSGVEDGHFRTRKNLQTTVDAQIGILWEVPDAVYHGYSNIAIPTDTTMMHVDVINYYDTYSFAGNAFGGPDPAKGQVDEARVKSLLTATKTSILGGVRLLTVFYYDNEGRVIQSKSQNHLGGTDIVTNTYSFTGELTASTRQHTKSGSAETTVATSYQYDHMGRKIATLQKINNQPLVVISKLDYNEVGQLLSKNLHSVDNGASFLQKTEFSYNERGWLKSMIAPKFSESLSYEDGTIPQWNGNIANQHWGKGTDFPNAFTYNYDPLNRLIKAESEGVIMKESITYDELGNINTLKRDNGNANPYHYNGNQLSYAENFTNIYTYDGNGNATVDGKTSLNLEYNYLNLPTRVSNSTGGTVVTYIYDATGKRLTKTSSAGTVNYINGIQYKVNNTIDFIQTEEGIARSNEGIYSYEYNLSDHLGNARFTFHKSPVGNDLVPLQEDNYYAFGLRKSVSEGNNKYLYNGKEFQEELGQYDYGARFYDPVIGRWNVIDAKADIYKNITPYAYAANTPTNAIDPDGHLVIFINGFTAFDNSIAGNKWYWREYTDVTKMIRAPQQWMDPGSWRAERTLTGRAFDLEVSKQLGDNHRMYVDGQVGYIEDFRSSNGTTKGYRDAPAIIESLHRTNGVIDETIKIITHSMGGVFGGGYLQGIKEYLNDHPDLKKQVSITLVADFDPYEASSIINDGTTKKQQFKHSNSSNIVGLGWLANENEQALDKRSIITNSGKSTDHSIFSFFNDISSLAPGVYKWDGSDWIIQ